MCELVVTFTAIVPKDVAGMPEPIQESASVVPANAKGSTKIAFILHEV